jgi:predicted dehydrogenase
MKPAGPDGAVRWGIVGAANIAGAQFCPALREAGGGRALRVASRDRQRGDAFAAAHGVEESAVGYAAVVEADDIDAVYVALPNSHHAEWTIRALEAGKAILCEKPLAVGVEETTRVVARADELGGLLWEAFVFPFQAQHLRLVQLLADGAIGAVRQIDSAFHFDLTRTEDIRLSSELGGGALADVGCYPVRLAHELIGAGGHRDVTGVGSGNGAVDTEAVGIVAYDSGRLVLSCGFHRRTDTFSRVLGTLGQIQLTNPFHPRPTDTLRLLLPGDDPIEERPTTDHRSFAAALRHIHGVVRGEWAAEHLASDSAPATAATLEALQRAVGVTAP